ncbi:hypothetical protein FCL47_16090 [Desulfopila sp. IMCC35006]|uniref:NACHT domain-containing protein n=1 Tax=Desulfopila sp. IMCC35006 TaxID=2569542 RepID=UPI0010ABD445|nr:hypothetical protein [Desulfopila sp. IMCC35006]TKB25163.1 hypothetical protein FCL47_16090 [Desulfopila sp. IMCC35006]
MDYDFSRLSTRSFEQLVQALAISVIGPGIVVFGDGPDGGREATFDGRIPFPTVTAPWNGYGVVQAKFRQRPLDTRKDCDWALAELKKDLEKFTDAKRKLRKPEYYLFATNVVLTPVAKTGSKDKATALIESYKARLGLKDFRFWDYDQICTLLDTQKSVREAYTAWITPGDVLAAVMEQINPKRPDFRQVMLNFVQKELLSEQYVNLGQAGHNVQDRIPLARVFVDLPVEEQNHDLAPTLSAIEEKFLFEPFVDKESGAISELLSLSAQRLDPKSNPVLAATREHLAMNPSPGRVVYIGGPGQGKSTLTQFFCQMHRVALLAEDKPNILLRDAHDTCELIQYQCELESLAIPRLARFPIRVELNRFAAALASNEAASLFDYLLQRVRQRSERDLNSDDLRDWLATYPLLLALDGLDEVPASSNRSQVLEAIQDFLVDAQQCNADLLLITTSRPQGYNDDFSPRYYYHRKLVSLNIPRALHYAERLIDQRWGEDQEKTHRLLERLRRASDEDATARLMCSPLQVTIMTLLVETLGEPPKERWRLFNEYYQVINRREKEREIPAAKLLNTYQADIDAIHQKVGLCLQKNSEYSGGTDALLTRSQFGELVEQRLAEEGHTGERLDCLRDEIIDAALERLVFLVAPREDAIGFEIRSLQEFMAAQWLMNGSDELVRKRLRAIAHAAHWRNVFMFAAGRCFHDKQHMRDSLHALCCELNEGDSVLGGGELEKATLAGSHLALDILEDGAVANQPAQIKLYLRLAFRLLELPPCQALLRLARQYRSEHEEMFQKDIERLISKSQSKYCMGAWQLLLQMIAQDIVWAKTLAERYWPQKAKEAIAIIKAASGVEVSDWLSSHWQGIIFSLPAGMVFKQRFSELEKQLLHKIPTDLDRLFIFADHDRFDERIEAKVDGVSNSFRISVIDNIRSEYSLVNSRIPNAHWSWEWLREAEIFKDNQSKELLSHLLSKLALNKEKTESICQISGHLAWPLGTCVTAAWSAGAFDHFANAARNGELGDGDVWSQAEERWRTKGLTSSDLAYIPQNDLPFDLRVGEIGFPFEHYGMSSTHDPKIADDINGLHIQWKSLPIGKARSTLAHSIFFLIGIAGDIDIKISEDVIADLKCLSEDIKDKRLSIHLFKAFPPDFWNRHEAIEILTELGGKKFYLENSMETVSELESLVVQHPNHIDLLPLLANFCLSGYRPRHPDLVFSHCSFEANRIKAAAILVKLAQTGWPDNDPSSLASKLLTLREAGENKITDALTIIRRLKKSSRSIEIFLSSLYAGLPTEAWEDRGKLLRDMQEYQQRHLSNSIDLP